MPRLALHFFGALRIERDGRPVALGRRRAAALLAYLALTGQRHHRESLAALFWPDAEPATARGEVRRLLAALNKELGPGWLEADRETVGLRQSPELWVDVTHFRGRLADCQTHGHPAAEACPACLEPLTEAAALAQGDFLAGFTIAGSPEFDTWQSLESQALRRELAWALERLIRLHLEGRQDPSQPAIACAQRWVSLDPLHEPAHRLLVELYARAGHRQAALEHYREYARWLREELGVPPSVLMEALYDRLCSGTPDLAPAPVGNLTAPATPFIGRELELQAIASAFADPDCRLLTLTGPGGIGKTRLAIQAAVAQRPALAQGAYMVELVGVASPGFVATAIATALAFPFHGDADPKTQLLHYLRSKALLLVLDNFEHLLDGAALLIDILLQAPAVKLLVTSRERLNVQPETVVTLQGLPYPAGETTGRFDDHGAVQLFLSSARRADRGFRLSEAHRPAVRRICQLLQGMPLGIELAATWVRALSPVEIAHELEGSLDFLSTRLRDLPERHRSLRAAFEGSWQRLSDEARQVFSRLSVFRGSFDHPAASTVAGGTLQHLMLLVDKSLVKYTASGRYELHEAVRQYAQEKLADPAGVCDRHCQYYAGFAAQREAALKGGGQTEALDAIGAEIENVRAAWQWAIAHRQTGVLEKLLNGLALFYILRSWYAEGREMLENALVMLRSHALGQEVLLGRLLACQGWMYYGLSLFPQADETLQSGLALLRRFRARDELPFALNRLVAVASAEGRPAEAIQLCEESLELCRELGDRYELATALHRLGYIASDQQGHYGEAQERFRESLDIRRALGDQHGIGASLNGLGINAMYQGDYAEARRLLEQSLVIMRGLQNQGHEAMVLYNLGITACLQHDYTGARQLLEQSLALHQARADDMEIAYSLNGLGMVAYRVGDYESARVFSQNALSICRRMEERYIVIFSLCNLGDVACGLGRWVEAERHFQEGLRIALKSQSFPPALHVLASLARLRARQGEWVQAAEVAALVLHHPGSIQITREQAQCLLAELEAEHPEGRLAAARRRGQAHTLEQMAELQASMSQQSR